MLNYLQVETLEFFKKRGLLVLEQQGITMWLPTSTNLSLSAENKETNHKYMSLILLICGAKNHSVTQTSLNLLPNSYQAVGGDQHTGVGVKLVVED